MTISEARIETAHAQRYLGQLCKHFGHRVPASQEGDTGRIEFPSGLCSLSSAQPGLLVLRTQAEDELARRLVEGVVGSHLERFAFRETLAIEWAVGPVQA